MQSLGIFLKICQVLTKPRQIVVTVPCDTKTEKEFKIFMRKKI